MLEISNILEAPASPNASQRSEQLFASLLDQKSDEENFIEDEQAVFVNTPNRAIRTFDKPTPDNKLPLTFVEHFKSETSDVPPPPPS